MQNEIFLCYFLLHTKRWGKLSDLRLAFLEAHTLWNETVRALPLKYSTDNSTYQTYLSTNTANL